MGVRVGGAVPVACSSVVAVGVAVGDMVAVCVLGKELRVGRTVAIGAENASVSTGGGLSEGCVVAVKVGVPVGNRVEVCVLVGNAVSVAGTVAVGTKVGDVAGVQAPMLSRRIPTTSRVRLIMSLYPLFLS